MSSEEFKNFVLDAGISDKNKDLWKLVFRVATEEQIQMWANLAGGNERHLIFLTDNIKEKYQVLKNDDAQGRAKIVIAEQDFVLQIAKG